MKGFTNIATDLLHSSELPIVEQTLYLHFAKDVDNIYFLFIQIRKKWRGEEESGSKGSTCIEK